MKKILIFIIITFLYGCGSESIEIDKPAIDYNVEICHKWQFVDIGGSVPASDMYVTFSDDNSYVIISVELDRESRYFGTWTWCEYGEKITFSLQNIVDCNGDVIDNIIFDDGLLLGNSSENGVRKKVVLKMIE